MVTARQTVTPGDGWLALANTLTGIKLLSGDNVGVIVKVDNLAAVPVVGELGDILERGERLDFTVGNVAYVKTLNSDRELVTYS